MISTLSSLFFFSLLSRPSFSFIKVCESSRVLCGTAIFPDPVGLIAEQGKFPTLLFFFCFFSFLTFCSRVSVHLASHSPYLEQCNAMQSNPIESIRIAAEHSGQLQRKVRCSFQASHQWSAVRNYRVQPAPLPLWHLFPVAIC